MADINDMILEHLKQLNAAIVADKGELAVFKKEMHGQIDSLNIAFLALKQAVIDEVKGVANEINPILQKEKQVKERRKEASSILKTAFVAVLSGLIVLFIEHFIL